MPTSGALRAHLRRLRVDSVEAAQHFVRRYLDAPRHDALKALIDTFRPEGHAMIIACRHCEPRYADPLVDGDVRFYNLADPGDPRAPPA